MSDIPEPATAVNGPNSDIPLIERAAVVLLDRFGHRLLTGTGDSLPEAVDDVRLILDAALDAELIARVLTAHITPRSSMTCPCGASWHPRHQAEAVRAALLGEAR